MNSRERVITALNHKEPDMVPIDCGGSICSTLTRAAHNSVKEYLHIDLPQEPIINPLLDTIVPTEQLLLDWKIDFRRVGLKPPKNIDQSDGNKQSFSATENAKIEKDRGFEFNDEFGSTWRKADYDFSPVKYVMEEFTLADLKKYKWPDAYDPGRVEGLREEAKDLHDNTEFCINADIICGGPFEQACWLRNYSTFLMDFYLEPEFASTLLNMITDLDIQFWDAYLGAVGDYVDVVCQGDDVGMQTQSYISPELYEKFVFPCHKRLFDFIHSKTKAKVFLHSCGSVKNLIPYFIEAGVDILNPVQYSAANMDLQELKTEFGKDICFWGGGISTQTELGAGYDLDKIDTIVKKNMEIMMKDGGYVFYPTHNIQHECPPAKTIQIFESANKYRKY